AGARAASKCPRCSPSRGERMEMRTGLVRRAWLPVGGRPLICPLASTAPGGRTANSSVERRRPMSTHIGIICRNGRPTLLAAMSLAAALTWAATVTMPSAQVQQPAPSPTQSTSAEEAQLIAQEAYIYLYPLITMDVTRKQLTNLDPKLSQFGGPAN